MKIVLIAFFLFSGMITPEVYSCKECANINEIVAANTKFGFNLFSELLKQKPDKNIFISPLSISLALSMTYNGAAGETRDEMARTLEFTEMNPKDVNKANLLLLNNFKNKGDGIQINIANSLWARDGMTFNADFLETNKHFYKAKITTLNFATPEAVSIINSWVKKETGGKIDKIIERIANEAILFLINAIYFKGIWTEEFDPEKTKIQPFHLLDGATKHHPVMFKSGDFNYYSNEKFQAVAIPYGEDREMSMYVFLPAKNVTLKEFLKYLHFENWQKWLPRFREMEGTIGLARFKAEFDMGMNDVLKSLGMEIAFDKNRADFSNMANISQAANIFIQEVKHKTFIDVTEEGTEAAAVTSVEVGVTSIREKFNMIVNRPFFYAIVDNKTGTILFLGITVKPK